MKKRLPIVPDALKRQVENKIIDCIEIIERATNKIFDEPTISYDTRGRTAGTANDENYHIKLNPILLIENQQTFIDRTVVHEFAHLVDGILSPHTRTTTRWARKRSVHGPSWKKLMILFGADPSRTHSYDTTNAVVRIKNKFRYICADCSSDVYLGPVRHKKHQSGVDTYSHSRCRTKLRHGPYVGGQLEYIEPLGQVSYKEAKEGKKKTIGLVFPPVPKKKAPRVQTKLEKAVRILKIYAEFNKVESARKEIIKYIMEQLTMSKAGATTYYYNAKKQL